MKRRTFLCMVLLLVCLAGTALVASAQSNPWEKPIQDIATSVVGPVALAGFLIALGVFCFMWLFGYSALGVAVGVIVGGAILGNADTIASWLGLGS